MDIIKVIIMLICLILSGMAVYYFLKTRRMMNENSDVELEQIMPQIQPLMKKLYVLMCILVTMSAIYIVVLITEFVLSIL